MRKLLIALAAAFLSSGGGAYAGCAGDNFCGSYTASATYATGNGGNGVPTVTDDFLPNTNFGLSLTTVGATTGWMRFITTSPPTITNGSGHTYTSNLAVGFTFSDPLGMNDTVNFTGTYSATYTGTNTGSDFVDWSGSNTTGTSSPSGVACYTGTNGDEVDTQCQTLQATFTDGVILDISLNNAQDWDITPDVEFTVVSLGGTGSGNGKIPEPASLALLGSAIAGLGLLRRRRGTA